MFFEDAYTASRMLELELTGKEAGASESYKCVVSVFMLLSIYRKIIS